MTMDFPSGEIAGLETLTIFLQIAQLYLSRLRACPARCSDGKERQ